MEESIRNRPKPILILTIMTMASALLLGYLIGAQRIVLVNMLIAELGAIFFIAIFFRPQIGVIATLISLLLESIFPNVPIGTSVVTFIGVATLIAFLMRNRFAIRLSVGLKPQYFFAIAFICWLIVTQPEAALTSFSGRNWAFTYLQLFILMWLTAELITPDWQRIAIIYYVIVSCITAVSAITQAHVGTSISNSVRSSGLGLGPNELALYLIVAMLFLIYIINHPGVPLRSTIASYIALAIIILGIVSTVSRTGFIAAVSVVIFSALFYKKVATDERLATNGVWFLRLIVFLALIVLIGLLVIPSQYWSVVNESFGLIAQGSQARGTYSERLDLWNEAIQLWSQHPIAGIGVGQFQAINVFSTHNMFLTILVEQGVVGLVLFVLWLVSIFRGFLRVARRSANAEIVSLATMWAIILLGFCIVGLTSSFQYYKILWLVAGISLALLKAQTSLVGTCEVTS